MQFTSTLIKGRLVKRYKRFLADVELESGELVVAHCPNTGAMTGCAEPGFIVWLSPSNDPKRKLKYTWELAQNHQSHWIGVNTNMANKVVHEAINNHFFDTLSGYRYCKPEVKYGNENSRIDFFLQGADLPDCYIEVKSVTLLRGVNGAFPDAKTVRGTKHLRELSAQCQAGNRCVLLYCVQHTGIENVQVASDIDPDYATALAHAREVGVEVWAFSCKIDQEKIVLNQSLDFFGEKKG